LIVAEQFVLLRMQQFRQLSDVGYAGRSCAHRMHDTALVHANVPLHLEVPVLALTGLFISGSPVALAFLVELGAAMMVAYTTVPERRNRSSSRPVSELKITWVSPCYSSR